MSMETRLGLLALACIVIGLLAHFGGDRLRDAARDRADRASTRRRALIWICVAGALFVSAFAIEEISKNAPKEVTNDYYQQQLNHYQQQQINEDIRELQDAP